MMYGYGTMYGNGMMSPLMWLFMIILWGFAVVGLICAFRWLFNRSRNGDVKALPETPLDILKKRYASGEINKEDFERMKKELE
jgi:putative membrane protein